MACMEQPCRLCQRYRPDTGQPACEQRLQARLAEQGGAGSARLAQRDPQGVAAAKLPRTVQPVEVEAASPEAVPNAL